MVSRMSSRFVLLHGSAALFCLSLAGCSDMLGLNGLSFEERSGGSDVATATGGTGGDSPFGDLGGGPSEPDDDFLAEWDPGLIVATAPARAGQVYLTYAPTSGRTELFTSDFGERDSSKTHTLSPDWTHVILVPLPEDDSGATSAEALDAWSSVGVIGYNAHNGVLKYFTPPFDSEEPKGTAHPGSPGRTHFVLLPGETEPNLLAYDQTQGHVRVGRAIPQMTQGEVTAHEWSTNWDELVPWTHAGEHGVLKLDFDGHLAEFEAFVGLGQGMEPRFSLPLEGQWSAALSFRSSHEGQLLIVYDAEIGTVSALSISEGEPHSFSAESVSETWSTGLTTLRLLYGVGEFGAEATAHALTYNAATGIADVLPVEPLSSPNVVK